MLALQQRDLGQLTGLFGQVATDRADRPGQLIPRVQLRIGNRAFEQLAVAIAQGQQNAAVRAGLSGHFVVGKQGCKLFLNHVHSCLPQLRAQRDFLRISFGKYFFKDLALARRWKATDVTPFERVRVQDPHANPALNDEAMRNLKAAWPVFEQARIASAWAGTIDVTPDSNPVIGPVASIPGLTLATGFSGHGFGTSPAAGQLAADLVAQATPLIDPSPYRFERFA